MSAPVFPGVGSHEFYAGDRRIVAFAIGDAIVWWAPWLVPSARATAGAPLVTVGLGSILSIPSSTAIAGAGPVSAVGGTGSVSVLDSAVANAGAPAVTLNVGSTIAVPSAAASAAAPLVAVGTFIDTPSAAASAGSPTVTVSSADGVSVPSAAASAGAPFVGSADAPSIPSSAASAAAPTVVTIPPLSASRMDKNGAQSPDISPSTWTTLTSFTAASGSTVTNGNQLAANGGGTGTVAASIGWTSGSGTYSRDMRVLVNGVVVWTRGAQSLGAGGVLTGSFSYTLNPGDQLTLQAWTNSLNTRTGIVAANTFLSVTP